MKAFVSEPGQPACPNCSSRKRESLEASLFHQPSHETSEVKVMRNQTNQENGEKPVKTEAKTDFSEIKNFMYFPVVKKLCEVGAYEI